MPFPHPFSVSNGVELGGILSPIPFDVYMNYLNVLLNCYNIRGRIENIFSTIYAMPTICVS